MPCQPAIASMSLGRASLHDLRHKLDQASKHGFKGIELFFDDLEQYARTSITTSGHTNGFVHETLADQAKSLISAAQFIKRLCDERGLTIIGLQPFRNYEGLKDRKEHAKRITELTLWIECAKALQTTMIGIPSTFLPADQLDDDIETHIADLAEAADMGARENPPIRFVYESLAWGTHVDTWERCWDVCQRVNRPNFGIVLDTFNIAARAYADPASACGTIGPDAKKALDESISRMIETVDLSKVYYIQAADGERLEKPIQPGHEFYAPEQPARMSWSRNCRLFYGEEERGAYLPVYEIMHAILDKVDGMGFEGWVSMEVFSRSLGETHRAVPKEHAERAAMAWQKLKEDFAVCQD